jgi:putative oxidoreductase
MSFDPNFNHFKKYKDEGLLLLRVGVGLSYILFHGWGKLVGGHERWISLGQTMPHFGVDEIAMVWGFIGALIETVGALLFAIGYKFRLASFLLGLMMLVAVYAHISDGDSWRQASHALKMMFVFFGMMTLSTGKYALDKN